MIWKVYTLYTEIRLRMSAKGFAENVRDEKQNIPKGYFHMKDRQWITFVLSYM